MGFGRRERGVSAENENEDRRETVAIAGWWLCCGEAWVCVILAITLLFSLQHLTRLTRLDSRRSTLGVHSPCLSTPRSRLHGPLRAESPPISPGPLARSCLPSSRSFTSPCPSAAFALLPLCSHVVTTPRIVNDPANEELIKWSDNGDSFYGSSFLSLFTRHSLILRLSSSPPHIHCRSRLRQQSSTMRGLLVKYSVAGLNTKNSRLSCAN